MALGYYIEGQKLDLFDDENIVISSSVQNINDISKVFSDFSQSITFPASKKNNIIFKHFNNPDIVNGFDHRTFKNSYIEIDTIPFKVGKTRLESVSVKNGKPEHYKCTFFGLLVSLKDRFKDDYISGLDFSAYYHTYDFSNVSAGLTIGLFLEDIIYPLISSVRRWVYNSDNSVDTNDEKIVNIAYESGSQRGINWNELKPALKLMRIVEAIEIKYGITFSRDFLGSAVFDNLYLWLSLEKGTIASTGNQIKQLVSWNFETGADVFVNNNKLIGRYEKDTETLITFDVIPETGNENVKYNISIIDDTTGKVFYQENDITGSRSVFTMEIFFDDYDVDYKIGFYISSNDLFSYTASLDVIYIGNDIVGQPFVLDGYYSSGISQLTGEINISSFMPKIKVIDFINGLINAYNLAVLPNSETDFYMDTLDDWYGQGKTIDITKYIDNTKSLNVQKGKILKEISFEFEEPKTFLAENYLKFNDTEFGGLSLELEDADGKPLDGETLKIKLPFEQMIYERLSDNNNNTLTEIQYGYAVDDKREATTIKPHIFYAINQTTAKSFSLVDETGNERQRSTAFMPFHGNEIALNPEFTTLWGSDINEWNGFPLNNSLFFKYYKDYIQDAFSVRRRVFPFVAKDVPAWLLGKIKLNDKLIIEGRRYLINKMDTNITTKEVEFELLNDIYD